MRLTFTAEGWDDYVRLQRDDRKLVARLNTLISDVRRSPFQGLGKPEPLRENLAGWWSRRLNDKHRLVYRVTGEGEDRQIEISQCRRHYSD